MAKYINTQGDIKTYHQLTRNKNPKPRIGTQQIDDYTLITPTAQPECLVTQKVVEVTPVNYMQTWQVVDLTQAEQDAKLEALKTQKKQAMKQARKDALTSKNFSTSLGNTFPIELTTENFSVFHQKIFAQELAGIPDTVTTRHKMADNQFYDISFAEIKEIAPQASAYVQAQFDKEDAKNAEIDAATLTTIEAISWES